MKEIIIDGENAVMGRLASYTAKQALRGNKVIILNSEKAIITGRRKATLAKYHERRAKGGNILRGPFFPRQPEKMLKRAIRGMLPDYRAGRGKEAFKRILCFKGIPDKYKNAKMIKAGKEKTASYIDLEEVSKEI